MNNQNPYISKRAKVVSKKPAYKSKEKTESGGYVWHYSPTHVIKRWKEKKEKIKRLDKNIDKLRKKYEKDLISDDLRTKAIAAIVAIMDETAARLGNEYSVKEYGTYGASTLKVKHIKPAGRKLKIKYVGKDQVKQETEISNSKAIKVIKELMKGKKSNDFIFEIDGKKIWDRSVNRYLLPFNISAKDLRGFHSNRLMKEKLKTKDFKDALEEVADIVGHEPSTLKNQYLDPDLVKKYDKSKKSMFYPAISKRALLPLDDKMIDLLKSKYTGALPTNNNQLLSLKQNEYVALNINPGAKVNQLILNAWNAIKPYMPEETKLTSGFRNEADQIRIINQFWRRLPAEIQQTTNDPFKQSQILRQHGYIVAPPQTTRTHSHLVGNSFDISGGELSELNTRLDQLQKDPNFPVKFQKLPEWNNNAIHINILNISKSLV